MDQGRGFGSGIGGNPVTKHGILGIAVTEDGCEAVGGDDRRCGRVSGTGLAGSLDLVSVVGADDGDSAVVRAREKGIVGDKGELCWESGGPGGLIGGGFGGGDEGGDFDIAQVGFVGVFFGGLGGGIGGDQEVIPGSAGVRGGLVSGARFGEFLPRGFGFGGASGQNREKGEGGQWENST